MKEGERYDSLFRFYAERQNLEWELLKAQAKAESNYNPEAVSVAGAVGLCQFMPATWSWAIEMKWIPEGAMRTNPEHSIMAQAGFMNWLLERFHERVRALAAYNAGPGRIEKLPFGPIPDSALPKETRLYIARIRKDYEKWTGKVMV